MDDSNTINEIKNKIASFKGSDSTKAYQLIDTDIESEKIKPNMQNGEGFYLEITFSDGGFRQYDADCGKLIGSSYAEDQEFLPSLE